MDAVPDHTPARGVWPALRTRLVVDTVVGVTDKGEAESGEASSAGRSGAVGVVIRAWRCFASQYGTVVTDGSPPLESAAEASLVLIPTALPDNIGTAFRANSGPPGGLRVWAARPAPGYSSADASTATTAMPATIASPASRARDSRS